MINTKITPQKKPKSIAADIIMYFFGFIGCLLYVAFSVIIVGDVEIGDK